MRPARSLNDLTDPDVPERLQETSKLKKNWSFSHLLDLEEDAKNALAWDDDRRKKFGEASLFPRKQESEVPLIERFQKRLAQEVLDVLERAHESVDKDRTLLLEDLFYNSSSMIEAKVLEKLSGSIAELELENRQMRMVRFLKGKNNKTQYYFELVSSYYCYSEGGREMVERMLPLCASLWSHELFPPIFSLLLHRWLLTHDVKSGSIIRFNVFLKGTNQLFWFDLQHQTQRLRSVYYFLIESVCRHSLSKDSTNIPSHLQEDFSRLICRFFFYYCNNPPSASDLKILLLSLPQVGTGLVAGRDGRSASIVQISAPKADDGVSTKGRIEFKAQLERFVHELAKHLPVIKREEAIIQYLGGCRVFGKESIAPYLSSQSRSKLQHMLHSFVVPGAPIFPTRNVRHCARAVMEQLFPGEPILSRAVGFGFNLFQPWYWPLSIWNMVKSYAMDILKSVPILGSIVVQHQHVD